MKKRIVLRTLAALICMAAILPAKAQTKPLMAEEVFKNVQVLKGIPADEFMNTMGFFAASLSFNCTSCHGLASAGDVAKICRRYAPEADRAQDDPDREINQSGQFCRNAQGEFCYTCHRGGEKPEVTPSLAQQYSTPLPDDPDQFEATAQGGSAFPPMRSLTSIFKRSGGRSN